MNEIIKVKEAQSGKVYFFIHYGLLRAGYYQGPLTRGESSTPMHTFYSHSEGRFYKLPPFERIAESEAAAHQLYIDYLTEQIRQSQTTIAGLMAAEQTNQ